MLAEPTVRRDGAARGPPHLEAHGPFGPGVLCPSALVVSERLPNDEEAAVVARHGGVVRVTFDGFRTNKLRGLFLSCPTERP